MTNDTHNGLLMLGCLLVSPFVLAANPRKTARLFSGGDWNSDYCSCTRVPDAMNPTCAVHGS